MTCRFYTWPASLQKDKVFPGITEIKKPDNKNKFLFFFSLSFYPWHEDIILLSFVFSTRDDVIVITELETW